MTKVTMPDPVGEVKVDRLGNTEKILRPFGLDPGYYYLITTDQAEAYADARVREALEQAAVVAERSFCDCCCSDDQKFTAEDAAQSIHALIPKA